jgi:hypothetical protein
MQTLFDEHYLKASDPLHREAYWQSYAEQIAWFRKPC